MKFFFIFASLSPVISDITLTTFSETILPPRRRDDSRDGNSKGQTEAYPHPRTAYCAAVLALCGRKSSQRKNPTIQRYSSCVFLYVKA